MKVNIILIYDYLMKNKLNEKNLADACGWTPMEYNEVVYGTNITSVYKYFILASNIGLRLHEIDKLFIFN